MKTVALLLMLFAISFGMRLLPFLFGKRLKNWTLLSKLSNMLPTCILILLVIHTLHVSTCEWPELLGLGAVVGIHLLFRNVLLSMGAGIACQQLLLHL